jgi:uncharacterized damage-inducible protein DinB
MPLADLLLSELDQETQTTRRVLERVPTAKLGWAPHQKSMTLGQLALHVAVLPGAIAEMSTHSPFEVPVFTRPSATTAEELVPTLEKSVAQAHEILRGTDDATLGAMWRMVREGRELFAVPRSALLRTLMLNHWYHHRGQLTVYLRELNVPVPSIYGPSADENPFA